MRRPTSLLAATVASAVFILCQPAARAELQSPGQAGDEAPSPAVSEQKLDAAASAAKRVIEVQNDYGKRIAAAKSSDKERLTGEANSALAKAVTDQGLSVDEYLSILQLAQNDPALRKKFVERVRPSGQ